MFNLSFVTTIFNTNIDDIKELINSFKHHFDKFEFVFVDDCSTNKEAIFYIKENYQSSKNVKIIELNENTKRYGAFVTGLKNSSGKYSHSLDSDDKVKIKGLLKLNKHLSTIDDDVIVFPNYIKLRGIRVRNNQWSLFSKKTLNKHKWNYSWPNFGAYNIAASNKLISRIDFPKNLKGPHDDGFFGQAFISNANNVRFLNVCWFIYKLKPGQSFSGKKMVAKHFSNHENLLMETIKLINPDNPLTYIPVNSMLISHIKGMTLLKTEAEICEWIDNLWQVSLKEKIKIFSYWEKLRFYKKTKNISTNYKKLL